MMSKITIDYVLIPIKLSLIQPKSHSGFQVHHFFLQLFSYNFDVLVFFVNFCQFLLMLYQFLAILVPLRTPLVPQGCYAVDEEGIELSVGFFVDVGQLRDISPQDLQVLLDELGLRTHPQDHFAETVDVAPHWQVHAHLLLLPHEHRKQYNCAMIINLYRMLTRTKTITQGLKQISKRFMLPHRELLSCRQKIGFGFCQKKKWHREKFIEKLESEIADLQKNLQQTVPQQQQYFKNRSWSINYLPQKQDGQHEIKILIPVKHNPPNSQDSQQFHQNTDENKKLNYSKANIFMRKAGNEKWLSAQMVIFDGYVQTLTFSSTQQPPFSLAKTAYTGPELFKVPKAVTEGVNMVFKQFGITSEVLMNMVIHASTKVEELELAWLKEMKQI